MKFYRGKLPPTPIFLVENSFYSEKIYHGNRLIALFSCLFLLAEPQGYHSEDQNIFVG